MIQELQTGILDINNKYTVDFSCKQLDDIILKIIVYDKSLPADLSDYNVRLKAFKADQVPLIQNTNISIKDNFVTIKASKQLTTTQGIVKAELQFINKTTLEKKSTFYINIEIVASVLDVDGIVSTPTCTILEEIDHKLDQIENIGEVLDEAKEVRDTLTNKTIPTATSINSKLETSTKNASTKITEVESIISSATSKIEEVETSVNNADSSKKELNLSKTNADISKENLDTANVQAEKNIEELNKIGDAKDLAAKVETNKSNIENLQEKVEDNTSYLKEKVFKTYSNPKDYGVVLNKDTSINDICSKLPNYSILFMNTDWEECTTLLSQIPNRYMFLQVFKQGGTRCNLRATMNNGTLYIASYHTGDNEFSGWKELSTVDDTGWIDISSTINSKAKGSARVRRVRNQTFFEIQWLGVIPENETIVTMPRAYAPTSQSEYVFCRFPAGTITLAIISDGRVVMDYKNSGNWTATSNCAARTSYLID
ncbi:viral A-type inclusion protein [Clostridium botulinum]|nr:viral A-type inclusion protein [Clostridium botulinum]